MGDIGVDVDAGDDRQMVDQDLGRLAHGFFGADRAIGPDFQDQLVVVGPLTDARPLHVEVDAAHRAEDRIHRQFANGQAAAFFGGAVAAPGLDRQFHLKLRVLRSRP